MKYLTSKHLKRDHLLVASALYIFIIISMSIPRVYGANWRAIMEPAQMRNLQGFPVQWESYLVLRSTHAMSAPVPTDDLVEWYSTDEYRATLPIYFAATLAQFTNNYALALHITDVFWWLLGALGVYAFVREISNPMVALSAGLLSCYSPIGVSHMGSGTLHTASSLSISLYLCILYRVLTKYRSSLWGFVLLGVLFFLSSITYTYQWFLIPFTLLLLIFCDYTLLPMFTLSLITFFSLRQCSMYLLQIGGLIIHVHQNDPVRAIEYFFSSTVPAGAQFSSYITVIVRQFIVILDVIATSYHPVVILFAIIGSIGVDNNAQLRVTLSGTVVTLGVSFFYGMPWVVMSGYPIMYFLVSNGVYVICKRLNIGSRVGSIRISNYINFVVMFGFVNLLGIITNLDIIGNDSFAISWWRGSYILH